MPGTRKFMTLVTDSVFAIAPPTNLPTGSIVTHASGAASLNSGPSADTIVWYIIKRDVYEDEVDTLIIEDLIVLADTAASPGTDYVRPKLPGVSIGGNGSCSTSASMWIKYSRVVDAKSVLLFADYGVDNGSYFAQHFDHIWDLRLGCGFASGSNYLQTLTLPLDWKRDFLCVDDRLSSPACVGWRGTGPTMDWNTRAMQYFVTNPATILNSPIAVAFCKDNPGLCKEKRVTYCTQDSNINSIACEPTLLDFCQGDKQTSLPCQSFCKKSQKCAPIVVTDHSMTTLISQNSLLLVLGALVVLSGLFLFFRRSNSSKIK
jgi:hypothetical protein